jgi:endonuclease G, mitochondrial
MATAMIRSDAPKTETIDDGSSGTLGPPPALRSGDSQPVTVHDATSSNGLSNATTTRKVEVPAGTVRIEIIITAGAAPSVLVRDGVDGVTEKAVRPWTDPNYDNRTGYVANFLGTHIPMPTIRTPAVVAKLADGEHELKYQNFSLVMHRQRRLCLFTAANVDNAPRRRRPDPSRKYGRAPLGGLDDDKDVELWFTDPRLPEQFQLPDRFFSRDGGSFDRGHVVMRESVCWGDTYTAVRRANGDTFHTTNCTPQVAGFNRSNKLGRWGQLENTLARNLKQERMSVFAGPILNKDDWWFDGVDDQGSVRVQIPSRFWKLVVGHRDGQLVAFAFRLEQDLSNVPLNEELDLDPEAWRDELVSVEALDNELPELTFPDVIKDADQYEEELGRAVSEELGLPPR